MKIDKKIRTSAYPSKLQFVNLREASMELLMQSQEMLFARDICMSPSLVGVAPIRAHTEYRQPSSDFTEITSSRRSKSHQRIPRKAMQVTRSRPCTCVFASQPIGHREADNPDRIETSIGIWKRLRSLCVSCPHLLPRIAWACQPVLGTLVSTHGSLYLSWPNADLSAYLLD